MKNAFVEVSDSANWAKLMLSQFEVKETKIPSKVLPGAYLLDAVGSQRRISTGSPLEKIFILDLQTEEGAFFWPRQNANPEEDLLLHEIWVCPLFLPFLTWFYKWSSENKDLELLPQLVELPHGTNIHYQGWRRPGESFPEVAAVRKELCAAFQNASRLPETMVEVMVFIMDSAGKASPVLRQYLNSLTDRDKNRWIGSLMSDSKRYQTVPGSNSLGFVPKERNALLRR